MAVIKVDGFDLYTYTRVAPGDGLDLAGSDFLEPQFTDSASGFGDRLISVQSKNRELAVPVHLRGTSKDNLHSVVSDLNRRLSLAKQLEWKDDGASNSSYLKIQFARFEPEFNKRRQDAGWMSGIVRIYTEPYAQGVPIGSYSYSTGSFAGSGPIASISLASRVTGDAPMTVRFDINTPSTFNPFSHGRIVGGAILPASYISDWSPASLSLITPSAILFNASGIFGSQAIGVKTIDQNRSNASYFYPQDFAQLTITCASAYSGNNRVLALADSDWDVRMHCTGPDGVGNFTAIATQMPIDGVGTLDLGVVNIDPNNGATYVLTFSTDLFTNSRYGRTGGAGFVTTSYPFELHRVILMPEDTSFLLVDDSRRTIIAQLEGNSSVSTAVITSDFYGQTISASGGCQSNPSMFLTREASPYNVMQGVVRANITGSTARGEFSQATAADIYGNAYFVDLLASYQLGLGKHTSQGDWYVRADYGNATLVGLSVIYMNGSVTGSVVASTGLRQYTPLVDNISLRMKQQGPVISGEAIVYSSLSGGRGPNASYVNMATISASAAPLAGYGTPLVSIYPSAEMGNSIFASIPSNGLAAGNIYTIDAENPSPVRNNPITTNVGYGLRGAPITFTADASKYVAAVAYLLPLDRSDAITNAWSANVSLNEQFTYAK